MEEDMNQPYLTPTPQTPHESTLFNTNSSPHAPNASQKYSHSQIVALIKSTKPRASV